MRPTDTELMKTFTVSRIQSILQKIDRTEGCWNWGGYVGVDGYGAIYHAKRPVKTHRLFYWMLKGNLDPNLVIDHLCRNRSCVNPSHLEQVEQRVNMRRGVSALANNARKTECVNGHEFTDSNTYLRKDRSGGRECRMCRYLAVRSNITKKKEV